MLQKLNELIDKKFIYKGNEITIKKIKLVSNTFVVITDKRTYNFFENEVDFFLSELKNVSIQVKKSEVKPMETPKQEVKNAPVQEDFDLKSILIESIQKIRADKSYIPQANAICNVVTQMINLKKIEIQIKNKT
jgi:hypothetical protein